MTRGRIRSWHADQPESPRERRAAWQKLAAALAQAGDVAAADALDTIIRTADALHGRSRHWADTVLEGQSPGSVSRVGRGRQAADLPYAIECGLALQDVGRRMAEIAEDYGLLE